MSVPSRRRSVLCLRVFRALFLAAWAGIAANLSAAPVPVTSVTTSGGQLTALEINDKSYPQAQLALPTLSAFAAGAPTNVLVPNGAAAPPAGARAALLNDWLLDTGLINPAFGATAVTVNFAQPIVNRPGADIVFMEINPGGSSDSMEVRINGITQIVGSGSWGSTGFATSSADLYTTGTTVGTLAALESASLALSSAEISQNVFGVGIDLSDFGIAPDASVTSLTFGASGAAGANFDPVFIAGLTGTGNPPAGTVSLPYVEPFATGSGAFTAGAEWSAAGGVYRNTITASNSSSSAHIRTADLGGDPATAPGFFLSSKFTIVSSNTSGNAVGFALFGTNAGFTGGVNFPYYLLDFRPGANVLRFLRVGVNNTLFLPDTTLQTMSVNAAQPFSIEVLGSYEFGALLMNVTIRQGALSETYYVVDSEPLAVGYFGYRHRTGSGTLTVDCDDFTLRHVSTGSFAATPAPFARAGVPYESAVAAVSNVGAAVTLTAPQLPAWMSFTPGASGTGTLSGTPPTPGGYSVMLAASDPEGGAVQQTFHVAVLEPTGVFISEFVADNSTGLRDEDDEQTDWLELFNSGDEAADVGGWWLSDQPGTPMKWAIPAGVVIPPRGFLVIFASGKNRTADPARLHTSFRLSNDAGSHLALATPAGAVVSAYTSYPAQRADRSYGAYGSYTPRGYLLNPTPGAPNEPIGYNGFVADTNFSVKRGFYTAPQNVSVTCTTPGATLVYTLDGSTPSLAQGTQGTSPLVLNIASTTILRVAAFAPGLAPSGPDTQSYFFLEDIRTQSANGAPPPGWPSGPVNGQVLDYGMDPDVSNSGNATQVKSALAALPTLSLVTDLPNLFEPATGIYVNPYGREEGFERAVSVELLHADNSPGFKIGAGLRIRGGASRQGTNPKHNFHLYFRGEYGASKLNYPLFGDEGADEFDRVDLRSTQVISWHASGDTNATYNRDEWNRATHGAMGQPYTRSRYYHLYINGHYWGIYGTQERADSDYAASYFGGKKADYDVMKTYVIPHRVAAADGDNLAWSQLHAAALAGFSSDAAYFAVQGLDASGQPNGTAPLLDVDNLIDYTLLRYYAADDDAPVNTGVGGGVPKNFYAIRPRDGRFGFRFFTHDAESTMINRDVTGTISAGSALAYFNPRWLSQQLAANPRYRLRFADRVQKHFFNGGAIDNPVALARWQDFRAQLAPAMLAESARWGDARGGSPRTVGHWNSANDNIQNGFLATRRATLLTQLRNRSLFPSFDAPAFSQHGGLVPAGYALSISSAAAGTTIHYTLDGSDPQTPGAAVYSGPVPLTGAQVVAKARARLNSTGEWSALIEAVFTLDAVPAAPGNLAISEIHYHPAANGDAEFVELVNLSTSRLDLAGVHFTSAMTFTFGSVVLEPGARILVVRNSAVFTSVYGGTPPVAGEWSGALNNSGDTVILRAADGAEIDRVSYDDGEPWPVAADGGGYSLVRIHPASSGENSTAWRVSTQPGGNPGTSDAVFFTGVPTADADHDGLEALLEHFLLSSDADGRDGHGAVIGGRTADGRATLTFRRRLAADDLVYTVQVSTSLGGWGATTTRTAQVLHGDGSLTETWTANFAATPQFMRLQVTKP